MLDLQDLKTDKKSIKTFGVSRNWKRKDYRNVTHFLPRLNLIKERAFGYYILQTFSFGNMEVREWL